MRDIKLPDWQPNERMILVLRRHPWIMFRHFLVFCVIVAVPFGVYFLIRWVDPEAFNVTSTLRNALVTIGASCYALTAWLFLFTGWVDYYLDTWILTSERIVSIEQRGLFARTTSEQRLSRVQDVTSVQKGKIATFLNFGDVQIQTAGTIERFRFSEVSNPEQVAQRVLEAHDAWLQAHPDEAARSRNVAEPAKR